MSIFHFFIFFSHTSLALASHILMGAISLSVCL